jgi:hypothetical protein
VKRVAHSLTRRELLQRAGLGALASAGVYGLVEELAPARARAASAPALPLEQHIAIGQRIVSSEGVAVVVPPLHHQVVTARLRVGRGRAALREAQRALEHALHRVEARHRPSADGLLVSVSWGLPYFRRYLPRLRDGRRFPDYLPADLAASTAAGHHVPVLLDAIRFPSDPPTTRLEQNDVCITLRSDHLDHIADGAAGIFEPLDGLLALTSIRRGFVGGGFGGERSLPKEMALRAGIPGADRIPETAQLFLGFTSTQRAALGPGRIANLETLPGVTDQWPRGYFRHGTVMHLSHVDEDVELWYGVFGFPDRLWRATDAGRFEQIPETTQTLPEGPAFVQSEEEVAQFIPDEASGLVGHSGSMQPVNRLQAPVRDNYGTVHPRGTAIMQRTDFNTLDNPFAWTAHARLDRQRETPSAGLHFVAFMPTADLFHRVRLAMDGRYADGRVLPGGPRSDAMGLNAVLHTTHRQNFLLPPRRHRSFPLAELL